MVDLKIMTISYLIMVDIYLYKYFFKFCISSDKIQVYFTIKIMLSVANIIYNKLNDFIQ